MSAQQAEGRGGGRSETQVLEERYAGVTSATLQQFCTAKALRTERVRTNKHSYFGSTLRPTPEGAVGAP